MIRISIALLLLAQLFIGSSSCISTRESTYFNNAADTIYVQPSADLETLIRNNDILSISISSLSPEASAIFNATNNFAISSSSVSGSQTHSSGYLVNSDGQIQLPIIGSIKATGLSKSQLKDNITKLILEKKLLVDPIVNIRHLNFEVTVIGEVGNPSVITVPNEKISLLKALGLAGDITIYGRKDNVLLIREENGKKRVKHIDLNSKSFLSSSYYYLQPNDVVYVEANKNKVASVGRMTPYLPAILSGLSVIILVVDRVIQ
jgi:polysaccharide export outer membrane protein